MRTSAYAPARGVLLVRPVDTAETLPGARIILIAESRERLTANQCEVIAVGAFATCDDDDDCDRPHAVIDGTRCHTHPVRSGDWLLCAPRSFIDGPDPERKEWFVHQDAVLGIFNSTEE